MTRKVSILLLLVLLPAAGYFAYTTWFSLESSQEVLVRIPPGATFDQILDSLSATGLIESRMTFRVLATSTGADTEIKPGTYKFNKAIPHARLLDALVEGHSTVRVKVTFPEGITIRRIAAIAAESLELDSAELVRLANNREFLQTIGINASTAEGYLMPDTYFFYWGEQPAVVLKRMAGLFREFYVDSLKQKAAALGLTPYEAVTLASIVEGEARVDEDRPMVAGLYLNRLKRGMTLDADPTIQYALPDGPRRLYYKDYKIESPYNTYSNRGLPPTPINNPGRASILATLSPAEHDYIYMVAKGDGSGLHTFSRNGREHQAAVREYRRNRDNRD